MSAYPDIEVVAGPAPVARLSPMQFAAFSAAVAAAGLSTIAATMVGLWGMWNTDPLKSIGMAVPFVGLALILRAWRGIGWRAEGTWWGLALLLTAALGSRVEGHANLVLVLSPENSRIFPPPSLVFLIYGIGAVLLLGGTRLLRAALFPVLLLFFVNPIPHSFNLWVDLPLQRVSAEVARALAIHLGHPLTPDRLRLMFTPDFGMFIAPGCNGVRGSLTMGLIALVTGYLYRFRWFAIALVTAGAVLLGYVFNLLRLCMLVFYYMVALHFPSLQSKAEQADYVIGAALFLIAALLLFSAIDWLRDRAAVKTGVAAMMPANEAEIARGQWARVLALGAMAAVGCLSIPQALAIGRARPAPQGVQPFPERIGSYVRERTWNEMADSNSVVYMWAQYAPDAGGTPVAIGISPVADWHNPLVCHSIRGDSAVWQGQMTATTAEAPVEFSSALYNDGITQLLEVSTLCGGGSCGEFVTRRRNFGFIYSFPRISAEMAKPARATRILLKIEDPDPNEPSQAVQRELTGQMQRFLAAADLDEMARPFGQ